MNTKHAFIDQFISGFYSRGKLSSELQLVTETNVTQQGNTGQYFINLLDTTPFQVGSVIVVQHNSECYETYFVTGKTQIELSILPSLKQEVTIDSKLERAWFNEAHAGKFYMRYLAQRLANSTELTNGFGENVFYANFDENSKDDVVFDVGTVLKGYSYPINKALNYSDAIPSAIGKNCYFETSTVESGIKFNSFYAKSGERLVLKLFLMNKEQSAVTRVSIKNVAGIVSELLITGKDSTIMKPYLIEFYPTHAHELLYVEIVNMTAISNTVYFDEVKVLRNVEPEDFILPRTCKILLIGDSWVAGDLVSSLEREPITQHLQVLLPDATIINKGFGGNKIQDVIARFDADVKAHKPDVVVLHIGVNDAYNPASSVFNPNSIDYFYKRVNEFVNRCLNIGAKPVIIGVPALAESDSQFINFELNDRARLFNQKVYRNIFKDSYPTMLFKKTATVNGSNVTINNLPTRYTTDPLANTLIENATLNIINSKNEIVNSLFVRIGDVFLYNEQ